MVPRSFHVTVKAAGDVLSLTNSEVTDRPQIPEPPGLVCSMSVAVVPCNRAGTQILIRFMTEIVI
jgi:hypothetical protein